MAYYWFNLSHISSQLASEELKLVLQQNQIKPSSKIRRSQFLALELNKPLTQAQLDRLGGIIWVGEEISHELDRQAFEPLLIKLISQATTNQQIKNYAIFIYDHHRFQTKASHQVNLKLKEKLPISYLNTRSSRINRKHLNDSLIFFIVKYKKTYYLLRLVWYYPWEEYIDKDKNRPFVQPQAGMLGNKLGRIMVNLSLDKNPQDYESDGFVLDPFAGAGTILIEALSLGLSVAGIEKHPQSFAGLKANLDWFTKRIKSRSAIKLYNQDATRVHRFVDGRQIISVVTEPYLGPSFRLKTNRFGRQYYVTASQPQTPVRQEMIDKVLANLKDLYGKWLKNQAKILKPGTKLVLILPLFHFHTRFYSLNLIDKKGFFDYTLVQGPYLVKSQRDLVVRRQVYVLRRK